jgi:AraC family transcriptional regulator
MTPRIETFKETKLIGKRLSMSFEKDKTIELWKSFSPRRKEINNAVNSELYSVIIYPDTHFLEKLNSAREYEKWAAIEVSDFDSVPEGMEKLIIPKGQYAVFHYKGKPSEAQETFRFIYGIWLPNSDYKMDDRPYFAIMGEKYKGDAPESEEDFWIPIKKK